MSLSLKKIAICILALPLILTSLLSCKKTPAGAQSPQVIMAEESNYIETTIPMLRDPFVLAENGVYYMYGTGWKCYKNTSGRLSGEWIDLGVVVQVPSDATTNYWAPEVHKYNGKY